MLVQQFGYERFFDIIVYPKETVNLESTAVFG
jgi:hypothetical protein